MSAAATLRALVGGEGAATVLGACRLEGGGVDVFGGEAILDTFRRAPVMGLDTVAIVESPAGIALFTATEAVFADLYNERIGRLWRVGARPGVPEPAVGVAFDPDLAQARAAVLFAATDHPHLAQDAVSQVQAAGQTIVGDPTAFRARAFVVRAFGGAARGAALFAVHSLAAPPVRTPSLTMATAFWDDGEVRIVRDPAATRVIHVRIAG